MTRQERRVAVEPAERRHAERVGGDLPREAGAHDEVGLERAQQRRDRGAARGHDDLELAGHLAEHPAELEAAVAAVVVADGQQRDGLVARLAQRAVEPEHDRQDPRHDHDAPRCGRRHCSRKTRAPDDWFRALTTISSMLTCHGRVSAHMTQSAMSSATSGSTPL